MVEIKIKNETYALFGKIRGRSSDKWNRATKLAARFEELDAKFRAIVSRGRIDAERKRCALAMLVMMQTGIRVGNEDSSEGYMTKPHKFSKKEPVFVQTYGLTTLKPEHLHLNGKVAKFDFLGKKQVQNSYEIRDKEILQSLHKLAKVNEADTVFGITDYQLNKFIKKFVGKEFTAKDFRCTKANLIAWKFTQTVEWTGLKKKEFRQNLRNMYVHVSEKLNNTPGVCKKSYVHNDLAEYLNQIVYS